MTPESLLEDDFYGSDAPLKKPPKYLFYIGITSIALGFLLGIYGLKSADTNAKQFTFGLAGYIFTAVLPLLLFAISQKRHKADTSNNHDAPYDVYDGTVLQNRFRKLLLVGLVTAALPIWIFFTPIAENFVG